MTSHLFAPYVLGFALFVLSFMPNSNVRASELNCMVMIQQPNITGVDPMIFENMRKDLFEYMNRTNFSDHKFEGHEKIRCDMTIILKGLPAGDVYEADVQLRATRPVHNSSYETITLNFMDKNVRFNYVQFQQLQFSETAFTSGLASLLNYYAFVILGFDYDSFALKGGDPFFERAQNQANMAAGSNEPGWQAMDNGGRINKYWLVENMRNNSYQAMHDIIYRYHREGLDKMSEDVNSGRQSIIEALNQLEQLANQNLNLMIVRIFLDTKANQQSNELVNIFKRATDQDKQRFVQIMTQLDPSNASQYAAVLQESE